VPRTPKLTTAALAVLAVLAGLTTVGCGAVAEKATEKATEKAIESQTGGDVDLDTDDGSVDVTTEDGSFSIGSGKVPEEWPDDVPLPEGIEIASGSTSTTDDGTLVSITATTTADAADLLAELEEALADWEISGKTTSTSGGGAFVGATWELDGRTVSFTGAGGDGETSLALTHLAP
jgi:hypothetical protein